MTDAKRPRRAWLVAIALIALVGAPLYVFAFYLPRFITADTALAGRAGSRSNLGITAPPGRMVVVIVDGLGYDVGLATPGLDGLRKRGVVRPLEVPFPSYTSPALVAFMTGLAPRDSGVRLNGPAAPAIARLDSLSAVASDAKRRFIVYDDGWEPLAELMAAPEDRVVHGELATAFSPWLERGFRVPASAQGDVTIVYFLDVDTEGHEHGADSPEYAAAVERATIAVNRHAAHLDAARDRLVVLSDHGHLADGGHGGEEPNMRRAFFMAVGPEIVGGAELDSRPIEDVAPTLAMLAGLSPPATNLGRPMLDVLDVAAPQRASRLAAPFDQSARFLCSLADHPNGRCSEIPDLAARLAAGDAEATDVAVSLLETLRAEREAELSARSNRALSVRLGALMVALAAFGFWARKRGLGLRDAFMCGAAPLALLATAVLVLGIDGYRITFSKMPGRDAFLPDAALAYGLGAVAAVLVGLWLRRAQGSAAMLLSCTVVPFVALTAYVGIDHQSVVPADAGLLVLLGAPALPAAALAALALSAFPLFRGQEERTSARGQACPDGASRPS
jgi:hypothetical protein